MPGPYIGPQGCGAGRQSLFRPATDACPVAISSVRGGVRGSGCSPNRISFGGHSSLTPCATPTASMYCNWLRKAVEPFVQFLLPSWIQLDSAALPAIGQPWPEQFPPAPGLGIAPGERPRAAAEIGRSRPAPARKQRSIGVVIKIQLLFWQYSGTMGGFPP